MTRDMIQSGELKGRMVVSVGLPLAIFEKAMMGNAIYDADIEAGIRAGLPTYKIYESLIFADINACDILQPIYESSQGWMVTSALVPPTIAHDTEATIEEARRYYQEMAGKM